MAIRLHGPRIFAGRAGVGRYERGFSFCTRRKV